MIYVETDDLAFCIEIHIESVRHFAVVGARLGLQLDIEAVRFWIIMKLQGPSF